MRNGASVGEKELYELLSLTSEKDLKDLYAVAYEVKCRYIGKKVSFRGLIEYSNYCTKNCYYCGIRKGNSHAERYRMSPESVYEAARFAWKASYGSVVLQSGERSDRAFVEEIETLVKGIKKLSNNELGITLSCGEQTEETFARWKDAGAHRYLLRIEASDPAFYRTLHPADHDYYRRLECLKTLRKLGYQNGSGVMFGLPGQTVQHMVKDLLFFKEMDLDMIGMGPYVVHTETPLAASYPDFALHKEELLVLSMKMIACARIFLKDVNIASTTALQSLHPSGREMGLLAGANVIMPNCTPPACKEAYDLYEGKTGAEKTPEETMDELKNTVENIGEEVILNAWGDSPHYAAKDHTF
ncbi:MAG: [Lentisphaeria bacterium]|nr:[FeFe] hydrogenase H-cluster radical SAM maturase HydE [Lentisphaeria bacterium]